MSDTENIPEGLENFSGLVAVFSTESNPENITTMARRTYDLIMSGVIDPLTPCTKSLPKNGSEYGAPTDP